MPIESKVHMMTSYQLQMAFYQCYPKQAIRLMSREFANGTGDGSSIAGRVIPNVMY